jgi:hypothetical protein
MQNAAIPDYQLTPSQWGAGGGSATHKEPTQAPSAELTPSLNMAANSPTLSLILYWRGLCLQQYLLAGPYLLSYAFHWAGHMQDDTGHTH